MFLISRTIPLSKMVHVGKKSAAQAAVAFIKSNDRVGMGTGSTVAYAIDELAEKLKSGALTNVACVPTSEATRILLEKNGIPVLTNTFAAENGLDVCIDGADEVDPAFNLIKGGGGALLREKVVASAAKRFIIIVDESKISTSLGQKFHLPVEVVPFAVPSVLVSLKKFFPKATMKLRTTADGATYTTDNGLNIIEVYSDPLVDPDVDELLDLAPRIGALPGVADHGFFIGMASDVIVGKEDGTSQALVRARPAMVCQ